jgi:hypothetical protein
MHQQQYYSTINQSIQPLTKTTTATATATATAQSINITCHNLHNIYHANVEHDNINTAPPAAISP